MGQISREYRLGYLPHWASGDERLHLPPPGYMAISEAILKTSMFLPFHLFIAFLELCKTVSTVGYFAFIFGLKALAKHPRFWYLTGWGAIMVIFGLTVIWAN